jgi:hypothetical protein
MAAKSEEAAHEAMHLEGPNKRIALLISVIALFLAFSETLGKAAQTNGIGYNVEASNLWAFFQAKTIRMTAVRTAAEVVELDVVATADPSQRDAKLKRIDTWLKTAARYDTEPETQEGRKELSARAIAAEKKRDDALTRYHHYEIASAALQIGIVLASASVITGMIVLAFTAGGLGLVGIAIMGLGLFKPELLHALHLI